jgi:hypothetical protein
MASISGEVSFIAQSPQAISSSSMLRILLEPAAD